MSEITSLSATVAGRYATALFELAREDDGLEALERDIDALGEALGASDELGRMIRSPLYSRDDQARAMAAIGEAIGLSELTRNVIGLMAGKRRLFVLPEMIRDIRQLLARHRGEVVAEVTAAHPLSEAQRDALHQRLREAVGQDVRLDLKVEEALIGGLIVKLGSRMIDTSIRSKLRNLQTRMKEAG